MSLRKTPTVNLLKNIRQLDRSGRVALLLFLFLTLFFLFGLNRHLFRDPHSTVLLSSEGDLLGARIATDGQWRFPAMESRVPDKFAHAIISFEDKRFWFHPGIDPISILRAVRDNFTRGKVVSGASTLSMQVIRMSRKEEGRTLYEKAIEALLALQLEATHTKAEILSLYASNAPFGGNVVGLDAASWRYFGRPASNLSWAEAATLAVLPNAPALIHTGRNRDQLLRKRNQLLKTMHRKGILDDETYSLALDERLPEHPLPLPMLAPHLLDRAVREHPEQVTHTHIHRDLQEMVLDVVQTQHALYHLNHVDNMAVLVVEVSTGRVISYVGNVYDPNDSLRGKSVDIIPAPRSSGSILKPLLYAATLDDGNLLPGTLVADVPFHFKNFSPHNFNRTFDGAVPAHRVLERSLNVPTVRILQEYGLEKFLFLLRRLGFTTINRTADNYGLTLVLGGAETSLWDVCQVYSQLSEQLQNHEYNTYFVHELSLYPGEERERKGSPLIGDGALWLTFESLQNLNRPEEELGWKSFSSSRRVAWKTGTSYGNRDAWSIGITPEYVVGVWVGNADGEGRPALTGVGYAAPVMFEVFNLLPHSSWFKTPESDLTRAEVCSRSGHLASSICPERDSIWIPLHGVESPPCPYHIEVNLSRDLKYRVNSDCEDISQMVREVRFVLPPAQEWYYMQRNAEYSKLPPLHPQFSIGSSSDRPMEIIYPISGMKIIPTRALSGNEQGVIFQAVHSDPLAQIYWHVDGEYLGTTRGDHKMRWLSYTPGPHRLMVVDPLGRSVESWFEIATE